jgi:hypothetical protein
MRRPLRTIQPLNMPQPSADLPLLNLRPCHLLLLLRAELHVPTGILRLTVHRARSRARHRAADITAPGAGVLEAIERHGEVAFMRDAAVSHMPLLGAERADELLVVGDHDDAAFVFANRDGEAPQGVAVEEVGGFVEDEEVRVVPHRAREDDFDFLPAAQTRDLVVVGDLWVEAHVFEVFGDYLGFEDAVAETFARGFVVVEFLDEFREAPFEERFARDLTVEFGEHVEPFAGMVLVEVGGIVDQDDLHFVLEGLLPFLSSNQSF